MTMNPCPQSYEYKNPQSNLTMTGKFEGALKSIYTGVKPGSSEIFVFKEFKEREVMMIENEIKERFKEAGINTCQMILNEERVENYLKYRLGNFSMEDMVKEATINKKKLNFFQILNIFKPLFETLGKLHELCKVGHFDISPKNFVCQNLEKDAFFAFIDFESGQKYKEDEIIINRPGTEHFKSPNRKDKLKIKPLSEDLYAMGVCLEVVCKLLDDKHTNENKLKLNQYIVHCKNIDSEPFSTLKKLVEEMNKDLSNVSEEVKINSREDFKNIFKEINLKKFLEDKKKELDNIVSKFKLNLWEECLEEIETKLLPFPKKFSKKGIFLKLNIKFLKLACHINTFSIVPTDFDTKKISEKLKKIKKNYQENNQFNQLELELEFYNLKFKYKLKRKFPEKEAEKLQKNLNSVSDQKYLKFELKRLKSIWNSNEQKTLNSCDNNFNNPVENYQDAICFISWLNLIREISTKNKNYSVIDSLLQVNKDYYYKAKALFENSTGVSYAMRYCELIFFWAHLTFLSKINRGTEDFRDFKKEINAILERMDQYPSESTLRSWLYVLRTKANLVYMEAEINQTEENKYLNNIKEIYLKITGKTPGRKIAYFNFNDMSILFHVSWTLGDWKRAFEASFEIWKQSSFSIAAELLRIRMIASFHKLSEGLGLIYKKKIKDVLESDNEASPADKEALLEKLKKQKNPYKEDDLKLNKIDKLFNNGFFDKCSSEQSKYFKNCEVSLLFVSDSERK